MLAGQGIGKGRGLHGAQQGSERTYEGVADTPVQGVGMHGETPAVKVWGLGSRVFSHVHRSSFSYRQGTGKI